MLSGKSLPSSRRRPQLRVSFGVLVNGMLSFWYLVGSVIRLSVVKARISTTVSYELFSNLNQAWLCSGGFCHDGMKYLR